MYLCEICGNDIAPASPRCPYCGNEQQGEGARRPGVKAFSQKTINLEQGLPTVAQALQRLEREIETARLERIQILTLIHGYGSSGKGGAIREECRKTLDHLRQQGGIKDFITGERFARKQGRTRHLLQRYPQLATHPHLNRSNRGITLVVLS